MPASPWMGSTRNAIVLRVMAERTASASPKGTWRKPGGKGPKPHLYWDSEEKPTTAMVRPWKLLAQTRISDWAGGDAAHGLAPLAGGFERGFDGFDAGVHGQGHAEAGELVEVAEEERELVVAEGAGGEGDLLCLGHHGGEDAGMAVALVDGGVGGEEVEVAMAVECR